MMTMHEMLAQVPDHYLCDICYQLIDSGAMKGAPDPVKDLILQCWVPSLSLGLVDGFGATYLFLKKGRDVAIYEKETFLDNFQVLSILMEKKRWRWYINPLLELGKEYIDNMQVLIKDLSARVCAGPRTVERCNVVEAVAVEAEFWLRLAHKLAGLIRSSYMYWDLSVDAFRRECERVYSIQNK